MTYFDIIFYQYLLPLVIGFWISCGITNWVIIIFEKNKYGRRRYRDSRLKGFTISLILNILFGPFSMYITRNRNK